LRPLGDASDVSAPASLREHPEAEGTTAKRKVGR